ncbi:Zinc finger, RING/FYVE/PHD-type [Cynara cardunculus var. scolymus]|uniref:Zinc finger, RING/FYVE/PHD-type n=1 Tax=Cynara cardunculus var. scolymus TaxID=59895 RepID=A0A103XQL5_CYNCS|nr:Zinc finger, RING/FYVE/PHD-type [Cynara cardunculus var. scolymus]
MSTPAAAAFIRRLCKITANCSLLKTLPTTTCAICMDDFNCQDLLLRLPNCHHIFHRKCILPWFSRNNTCPLCRRVFPPEKPKIYSIPLRSHILRIQHRSPFSQQSTNTVLHLNFHLRSDQSSSSTNSDPPQPLPSLRPLEIMLLAEGLPELASRASGPFWISADLTSNVPPAGDHQRD